VDRLLIEPVLAARHLSPKATSLLDAGSGGGSPAIPMKLARPDLALNMVEVKVRKSVFLRQVSRTLGLQATDVLTARFEELLTRSDLHEAMSVVSIRAVRVDARLMTTLQAFLRPGGDMLSFVSTSTKQIELVPPMAEVGAYDLLPENRSRLIVLRKATIGLRST
jgi:16S rRNA (guanine527-N7)-methyltransferase